MNKIKNKIKRAYLNFRIYDANHSWIKYAVLILLIVLSFTRGTSVGTKFSSMALTATAFIMALVVHEFGHAYVAYKMGDNTAKSMGRLTLNPFKHIDTMGMLLPILMIISGLNIVIGWAKPIPINYNNLKSGKLGIFLVSIGGFIGNIILATIAFILFKYVFAYKNFYMIDIFLIKLYMLNIFFIIINLIPIPPLDGSRMLYSVANYELRNILDRFERLGPFFSIMAIYFIVNSRLLDGLYNFFWKLIIF